MKSWKYACPMTSLAQVHIVFVFPLKCRKVCHHKWKKNTVKCTMCLCSSTSSWLFGCSNSSFTHSVDECEATRIDKHANEELENSMQVCFLFSFLTCLYSTPHPLCLLALLHSDGCFCDLKNVLHRKIWRIFFFLVFVERTTSVSTVTMCAEEMCVHANTERIWFKSKKNVLIENKVQWLCIRPHKMQNVCVAFSI